MHNFTLPFRFTHLSDINGLVDADVKVTVTSRADFIEWGQGSYRLSDVMSDDSASIDFVLVSALFFGMPKPRN